MLNWARFVGSVAFIRHYDLYHHSLPTRTWGHSVNRFNLKQMIMDLLLISSGTPAAADSYGIFDARGLALGGTGVALGNVDTGHFYNPALTAFHAFASHTTRLQVGRRLFSSRYGRLRAGLRSQHNSRHA